VPNGADHSKVEFSKRKHIRYSEPGQTFVQPGIPSLHTVLPVVPIGIAVETGRARGIRDPVII
jgi:hypothetical protein